jgi:hypothetical protein
VEKDGDINAKMEDKLSFLCLDGRMVQVVNVSEKPKY